MNFFIKKESTLPLLKYPLKDDIRKKYNITDEMMENVAITFSMFDVNTGKYKIANVPASLILRDYAYLDQYNDYKYTLSYKFTTYQTSKEGMYYGEFCIDFLGGCGGKIKLPVTEKLIINISNAYTKTTVI